LFYLNAKPTVDFGSCGVIVYIGGKGIFFIHYLWT